MTISGTCVPCAFLFTCKKMDRSWPSLKSLWLPVGSTYKLACFQFAVFHQILHKTFRCCTIYQSFILDIDQPWTVFSCLDWVCSVMPDAKLACVKLQPCLSCNLYTWKKNGYKKFFPCLWESNTLNITFIFFKKLHFTKWVDETLAQSIFRPWEEECVQQLLLALCWASKKLRKTA